VADRRERLLVVSFYCVVSSCLLNSTHSLTVATDFLSLLLMCVITAVTVIDLNCCLFFKCFVIVPWHLALCIDRSV